MYIILFYIDFVYYECKNQFTNLHVDHVGQKLIYVANEYPNYVRNRLNANENFGFWAELSCIEDKHVYFDGKQANFMGNTYKFFNFQCPTVGS